MIYSYLTYPIFKAIIKKRYYFKTIHNQAVVYDFLREEYIIKTIIETIITTIQQKAIYFLFVSC
jgi:hypothetical protein